MNAEQSYMVTDADGREFGPVGEATLKKWDQESRFDSTTRIRNVQTNSEMSWLEWQQSSSAASVSEAPQPQPQAPQTVEQQPAKASFELRVSTSGYKSDVFLAVAFAAIGLLSLRAIGAGAGGVLVSLGTIAFCGWAGFQVFQGRTFGFYLAGAFGLVLAFGLSNQMLSPFRGADFDLDLLAEVGLAHIEMLAYVLMVAYSVARATGVLGPVKT